MTNKNFAIIILLPEFLYLYYTLDDNYRGLKRKPKVNYTVRRFCQYNSFNLFSVTFPKFEM